MAYEFKGNTALRTGPDRSSTEAQPVTAAPRARGDRTLAQVLAAVFGLTFLLVGIAGFIPGVTTDWDELSLFGTDSHAELLGLFRVSVLHNVVHMLFGVGLLAAARDTWAKAYLLGGGAAYLLVTVYGAVIDLDTDANFLPFNDADNLLHTVLSLGLMAAGAVAVLVERRRSASA